MELNEKGLPFFPELRFEDKRHIYTLGGQILPSVTTVMKRKLSKRYRFRNTRSSRMESLWRIGEASHAP